MKLRSMFVFSFVVILSMLISSCAPTATQIAQTTEPSAPTSKPQEMVVPTEPVQPVKDTLIVAINGQPARLQPQAPVGRLNELVNALIFDALLTRNLDGKLTPALAESWTLVDPVTWEFKLRANAKFHNGDLVTSEDVKFTYEQLVLNPDAKSPHKTFLQTIKEVKVIDDLTFQVITTIPDVVLPSRLFDLYGSVVPKKYYEKVGDAGFDAAPVGAGPYKFVSWTKDSQIVLEAFPEYWGEQSGYKNLILKFISDDATRMAAVMAGEVDIASTVPPARAAEIGALADYKVTSAPSSRYYFLVTDTTKAPFNDLRVRQALMLGIDREALVKGIAYGYGTPIMIPFIPQTFGYDPSINVEYNPEKAKQLLADAGYPNGLEIGFDAFTGSIVDHSKLAEAISAQLELAGFKPTLNIVEFGVFGPKRLAHETAPLYIYSLGDWAFDMGVHLKSYVEGSQGYYNVDPVLGAKIDAALSEFDTAKRLADYKVIQKDFYDQALYSAIYQLDQIWVVSKSVDWTPQMDEMLRFNLAKPVQ
jgi:peptide/nickel transport system substrate-binding protein